MPGNITVMYMFCTNDIGQLTIGDFAIEWVKEYRYLGILLDRSLSFVPLATVVSNKMRKRLFGMQRIACLTWGAAGTVLDIFYKQEAISLFDYASPFLAIAELRCYSWRPTWNHYTSEPKRHLWSS
jgi:hypothetical protein